MISCCVGCDGQPDQPGQVRQARDGDRGGLHVQVQVGRAEQGARAPVLSGGGQELPERRGIVLQTKAIRRFVITECNDDYVIWTQGLL